MKTYRFRHWNETREKTEFKQMEAFSVCWVHVIRVHFFTGVIVCLQVTTDLRQRCTDGHTGTSVSAPMVAGVIALALEAKSVHCFSILPLPTSQLDLWSFEIWKAFILSKHIKTIIDSQQLIVLTVSSGANAWPEVYFRSVFLFS